MYASDPEGVQSACIVLLFLFLFVLRVNLGGNLGLATCECTSLTYSSERYDSRAFAQNVRPHRQMYVSDPDGVKSACIVPSFWIVLDLGRYSRFVSGECTILTYSSERYDSWAFTKSVRPHTPLRYVRDTAGVCVVSWQFGPGLSFYPLIALQAIARASSEHSMPSFLQVFGVCPQVSVLYSLIRRKDKTRGRPLNVVAPTFTWVRR